MRIQLKECPKCEYINDTDTDKCIKCGTALTATGVDLLTRREKKWARFFKYFTYVNAPPTIVLAIITLIKGGIFVNITRFLAFLTMTALFAVGSYIKLTPDFHLRIKHERRYFMSQYDVDKRDFFFSSHKFRVFFNFVTTILPYAVYAILLNS